MAVVSQEPLLFSGSVADNIRYGLPGGAAAASDAAVEAAARQAQTPRHSDWIRVIGLSPELDGSVFRPFEAHPPPARRNPSSLLSPLPPSILGFPALFAIQLIQTPRLGWSHSSPLPRRRKPAF